MYMYVCISLSVKSMMWRMVMECVKAYHVSLGVKAYNPSIFVCQNPGWKMEGVCVKAYHLCLFGCERPGVEDGRSVLRHIICLHLLSFFLVLGKIDA